MRDKQGLDDGEDTLAWVEWDEVLGRGGGDYARYCFAFLNISSYGGFARARQRGGHGGEDTCDDCNVQQKQGWNKQRGGENVMCDVSLLAIGQCPMQIFAFSLSPKQLCLDTVALQHMGET